MEGGDYWKVLSSTNPLTTVPQKTTKSVFGFKRLWKSIFIGISEFKVDPLSIIDINFTVRFNYLKMNCWF